jgi:hypothetical protein
VASNFSCIGFPVASGDDFVTLAEQVASIATPVEAKAGTYLRWSPPTGEELWLQVDRGKPPSRHEPALPRPQLDAGAGG